MPMPATIPNWNTGGANRTEPSAGKKVLGWVVGEPANSSFFNWWMFTVYEWILWLSGIEGEALTWSALQTFGAGITVPAGGVAVTGTVAASTFAAGASYVSATGSYFEMISNIAPAIEIYKEGTFAALTINSEGPAIDATASGALGISITGGTTAAVKGTGALTGYGGLFQGGTSAAGVRALGGTGGVGVSGMGGQFVGGSPTIGTGSVGVYAIGGNAASGGLFEAGAGSAPGLTGTGGNAGGPGVRANNGLDTIGPAVDCRGSVDFLNATAPASNVALANKLTKKSFVKAWALIECNGTVAPVVVDGLNIASVAQSIAGGTNGDITVNLANAMTSTDHGVRMTWQDRLGNISRISFPQSRTSSQLVFRTFVMPTDVVIAATDLNGSRVLVEWIGAQ